MVSDIVLLKPIPEAIMNSIEMYVSCIAGASLKSDYLDTIKTAGFQDVRVVGETSFGVDYIDRIIGSQTAEAIINYLDYSQEFIRNIANSILSVKVTAVRPA